MTLLISRPLNIIMEEDELSPRSPSPYPSSIKATRRHARITGNDLADLDTASFPSNRPVYRSPSPASSSDSLKLSLTDLLKFPYPPTSYLSSSPHSPGMPITPDSDVDFTLPSPCFRPANPVMLNFSRESIDLDADSDSEWYHNEFSKLIETPYTSPLPPSRPDSIFISTDDYSLAKCRSITSDMVYPRKRNSKSRSIILPSYRPLPPLPQHPPPRALLNISRPPPRSTLPADCVVDLFADGDDRDADSDSSSLFSFTMYDIDLGDRRLVDYASPNSQSTPQSPVKSRISFDVELGQEIEVDLDDARFELDYQLPLPFSIPATPLDLEFDITKSFERLGDSERVFNEPKPPYTPCASGKEFPRTPVKAATLPAHARTDPTISPFVFPPSPSPGLSPGLNREERVLKSKWSSSTIGSVREEHARTKTKPGRTASSKLKLYFGGGTSTPPKTPSKHSKTPSSSTKSFSQPSSPLSSTPSRKTKTHSPSLSPSPSPLRWPSPRGHKRKPSASQQTQHTSPTHRPTNSSDLIIIGYGQGARGLKRRGSSATVSSEAMSETSNSSSSSIGMRRKPIPIEMFLRNATCPPRYLNPV